MGQLFRVLLCWISSQSHRGTARWRVLRRGLSVLACVLMLLAGNAFVRMAWVGAAPQGKLETPAPGSFQSGVDALSTARILEMEPSGECAFAHANRHPRRTSSPFGLE